MQSRILDETQPSAIGATASTAKPTPDARPHRFRHALLRRLKVMAILFVVYALSIGPMFWTWYESKYLNASPWIALFYEPLFYLTAIPLFSDLLNAWIDWWILS